MRVKPQRPRINKDHPLARGLILAVPFWERGGTELHDVSDGRHVATFNNASQVAQWDTAEAGGYLNYAASKVGDWATIPASESLSGGALTVAFVARWDADVSDSGFVSQFTQGNNRWFVYMDHTGSNFVKFFVTDDFGDTHTVVLGNSYADGEWHLIVCTWALGSPMAINIDGGVEIVTGDTAAFTVKVDNANTEIGTYQGLDSRGVAADIADVKIWDRRLTPAEISDLYADCWKWEIYTPPDDSAVKAPAGAANTGTSAITLPIPQMIAVGQAATEGAFSSTLPIVTMSSSGIASTALSGTSAITLPIVTMAATGQAATTGTSAITLPIVTMSSSGLTTSTLTGTSAITLPIPTMAATGARARTGTSAITIPILTMSAIGSVNPRGACAITLPMPSMFTVGSTDGFVPVSYVNRRRRSASPTHKRRR